ncbi:transmembrane protein 94 isoform X2 [Aethina tumida]|uniref:transmembrane protein 94 isoform X2 n=1 Tax=Aethina tumida TaxID=116153 RepID=UPI0021494D70|nr:transmembrane protein 94 isoform X2 [Aethina tumida]
METNISDSGLTTRDALNKLHVEIDTILQQFKTSQKTRRHKSWIKDALHHSSQRTTINWLSASFQLWTVASLTAYYIYNYYYHPDYAYVINLCEAFVILTLLVINVSLELYDNKLRHNEIPNRIQAILDKLRKEIEKVEWKPENYPNLFTPFSPCITLQWTLRDNKLVNMPWSLLVKDDIILIRPGQISPGYCEAVDKNSEYPLLHAKEVYAPSLQNANEILSAPKCRKPLENKKYRLLETPYLNNLRVFLEQALDRPVTQHNQHRHRVMIKIIERIIMPAAFLITFVLNLFKFLYFMHLGGISAAQLFLLRPSTVILPLLPLVFPLFWNLLNYSGMARFKTIFGATRRFDAKPHQLEEDTDTTTIDNTELKFTYRDIWNNFCDIMMGKPDILIRSANILHVLGSVTALCCVDKKGILSWPNPTAEKVFFLHNDENNSPTSSLNNVNDLTTDNDNSNTNTQYFHAETHNSATAEVLDLTHNHDDPFKLHFDDQEWDRHMSSLKPLGLAILLNTCNFDTQDHYTAFCQHITCEAMYNENLVPVTNRRCLCELAKEIGFQDQAQKIFELGHQLSTFRHLQPEMVRRDNKYARSLQLSTKLKFPFPHMFAVVVKEVTSGSMQLLSEGTADIILDSCVEYWDGRDLCTLSHSDRKKIQDFYQRSSLTAYCTAFAYRPLTKCINDKLSDLYLELPSDSRHLYMSHRSPTPAHWECKSVLEPRIKAAQFYSTDSLLYNDYPTGDVSDADSCFQMQCNQVFIGMVTMQYQALTDMVQLIEQLERACIRFVHFSKENELRSRVFSEKMGLESGWNCHISLLSERNRPESGHGDDCGSTPRKEASRRLSQSARRIPNSPTFDEKSCLLDTSNLESSRTMSFSAPSAINMEHSVVKFDTENERTPKKSSEQSNMDIASQESVHMQSEVNTHDWQSLSCLTDSTEQSAPINFDMSNRAKLPRGIDKIRPHIELIDNVPLLVSLFTDCTPSATREMLQIMQEYGEIVCIMGSSENFDNCGIFMQADASIAVEPLYPQVCQKREVFLPPKSSLSPITLSCELNSIACSLCVRREEPISFYHLIMEARHFIQTLWSSVQFWLSCCFVLSFMELIAALLMLPPVLTIGQTLWLCCIVIPAISLSLMVKEVDPDVMKKPQGKIQNIPSLEGGIYILWCYGSKFLPTVLVVLVSYIGVLSSQCQDICLNKNCTCAFFYIPTMYPDNSGEVVGWPPDSLTLYIARLLTVFIIMLHFVVISMGFVHRDFTIFKRRPTDNLVWLIVIFVLTSIQALYTVLQYNTTVFPDEIGYRTPSWVVIFAALSPLFIFAINEIVKKQEINVTKRFLKRARLDFGTKLGMNSPF